MRQTSQLPRIKSQSMNFIFAGLLCMMGNKDGTTVTIREMASMIDKPKTDPCFQSKSPRPNAVSRPGASGEVCSVTYKDNAAATVVFSHDIKSALLIANSNPDGFQRTSKNWTKFPSLTPFHMSTARHLSRCSQMIAQQPFHANGH